MKKIIKSEDRIDWRSLYDKYKDDDEMKNWQGLLPTGGIHLSLQ